MKPQLSAAWLLVACAFLIAPSAGGAAPGDLDPSFGEMGLVDLPSIDAFADLVAEPDGDLYVAKAGSSLQDDTVLIVRLTSAGEIDQTFGVNGTVDLSQIAVFPDEFPRVFNGIEDAPDGGIIASFFAAPASSPFDGAQAFVRILSDGSFDASFGDDGVAQVPRELPAYGTGLFDVDSLGRVLVPGDDAVRRLGADGQPDPSFGGDGSIATSFSTDLVEAGAGDSVYALGPAAVTHLLPDGAPDPGFGSGGVVELSDDSGAATTLELSPTGDLYTGVRYDRFANGFSSSFNRALRLKPDGTPDLTFDQDNAISEIDQQGRLLGGGEGSPGISHPRGMVVERFTPDGDPDQSFGYEGNAYGIFTPDLATGRLDSGVHAVAVQGDGSVVVAGSMGFLGLSGSGLGVARFLADPGPADADADGLGDEFDRCPFLGAAGHEGCPTVGSAVKVHSKRHKLEGIIESPDFACLDRASIQIVRVRRGKHSRVSSTVARRRDGAQESTFRTRRLRKGRYFARVAPAYATDRYSSGPRAGEPLGAGYCLADRSYVVALPGTLTPPAG